MVTEHAAMLSGFLEKIQTVLSVTPQAIATDVLGHPKAGAAVITYDGGVGAFSLVAPTAGSPNPPSGSAASLGTTGEQGDDGKILHIQNTTAHAHVITTPASKINGNKNTITFAAPGDSITLFAYNGIWYVVCSNGTAILGGA